MRDGRTVLLRPIKPEDEPLWLEMFQKFSDEAIRYRFFEMIKNPSHEVRMRYCSIDYDKEMAIVAELTEEGRKHIMAVVRLSMEPDRKSGEIAFIVADPYQTLGLGTKMVEYMVEICQDLGLEAIYGISLPDNLPAIRLMKRIGFTITHLEDGTVKAVLNLKEELPDSESKKA